LPDVAHGVECKTAGDVVSKRTSRRAPFNVLAARAANRLKADDVQSELVDVGRLDDCSPRSPSRTMAF
jgi:hypothetical protein